MRAACDCAKVEGKKLILSNFVRVGIVTEVGPDGVFVNNVSQNVDHNFCPQCGAKYEEAIA